MNYATVNYATVSQRQWKDKEDEFPTNDGPKDALCFIRSGRKPAEHSHGQGADITSHEDADLPSLPATSVLLEGAQELAIR